MDVSERSLTDHFADWESHVFGFGYGSGEEHTLGALKRFLALVPTEGTYDHRALEANLGPVVAWLLINTLCGEDIIEYGTSPRYGWLTEQGKALRDFMSSRSLEELIQMTIRADGEVSCCPDFCNCGPNGYSPEKLCHNPFWRERRS